MSQCLASGVSDCRSVAPSCGRWYRRRHCKDTAKRVFGDRARVAGRFTIYVLLFLLPGGGLFLLFRWLYLRLRVSDRRQMPQREPA